MGIASIEKLKLDNYYYDENSIKLELTINIKYNCFFPHTIKIGSLSGDLHIVNKKIKITSKDKIGKFICPDLLKLEYGKENAIKLYLTLYYVDIFFSNIPKASFNIEYEIHIISGYLFSLKFLPLNWFIKEIIGNIKKVDNNMEYNIYINSPFIFKEEKRRRKGNINL